MYRLARDLRELEPDNASRLIIGLKYARDELILHQMQQVRDELDRLALSGAIDEQKQLLAKLERLQQLLLSTDLDFEMRLARLRAIRDTLRKLDGVIKEESRQEKVSQNAADAEKRLESLAKREAALAELIKRQQEHLEGNGPLAKAGELSEAHKAQAAKLAEAQTATRDSTKTLADQVEQGARSQNLAQAVGAMSSAAESLAKPAPSEAQAPMEQALAALKKELEDVARQKAEAQAALARERFAAMREDQQANRGATDQVSEMTRQLGSSGSGALAEILRASGSMASAEGGFGKGQAGQGNADQDKSLASLKYAQELLAEEAERLARQLRAEVKKRVTDGLSAMLEMQVEVRTRTEALSPTVKQGSRQALAALTALAKREEKITATAQELINVVEETEFGIALPAALAAVRDATEAVQLSLAAGDASSDVIAAEKQIEADLKAMLEVVNEMTDANSRRGRRQRGNSPEDERKELNRIISELKMIRLLETRVRQNTIDTHAKRAASDSLSPELRKRVEAIEGRQADIQEATEILAIERADDLPQPQ
jgi:hypothetical protein